MKKQELASLIWESCNQLRGSISTVEYKDIVLGFVFYRYLSNKEYEYLIKHHWTEENMKKYLNINDQMTVKNCKKELGYFISYDDMFSSWLRANSEVQKDGENEKDSGISISTISQAINRFEQNISKDYLSLYQGIFESFSTTLPQLLTSSKTPKVRIKKLISTVGRIPMDDKQGYDVLGFIYEYLISNFASNAGKKDGEFYTPFEISVLMSEIIADHLKDRETISILDPTSGSGSLLINIGQAVQKHMMSEDNVLYYAQEKIQATCNLTKMNLIMRGVKPGNLSIREGDTLEADWPYFSNEKPYQYVPVDCVVSNPPYSQKWDSDSWENDPRYQGYGVAPAKTADYAFLLHELYHLKPDGIMCIVLPHGVLFRGDREGEIRKNLVDRNNIDTIIGLPEKIFFGTGIATIIMVLRKDKTDSDILFVDASKEFYKDGPKNKLGGHNIRKIVDAVLSRQSIPYFSKLVTRDEIIDNGYNLNIPRYISSDREEMPYDPYSVMFGDIPVSEVDQYSEWWDVFPTLKEQLFERINPHVMKLRNGKVKDIVNANADVKAFVEDFRGRFSDLGDILFKRFTSFESMENVYRLKSDISSLLFEKAEGLKLIDRYQVYKAFDEKWDNISYDIQIIRNNGGLSICREVEDVRVFNKKNEEEEIKGQKGKIIPYELIGSVLFKEEYRNLNEQMNSLSELQCEFESASEELSEDAMLSIVKDQDSNNNDAEKKAEIDLKKLKAVYEEVLSSLENEDTKILSAYNGISGKDQKIQFQNSHNEISWPSSDLKAANGTYPRKVIDAEIRSIRNQMDIDGDNDSVLYRKLYLLSEEEKALSQTVKKLSNALKKEVEEKIINLTDSEIYSLLREKWVTPIVDEVNSLPDRLFSWFCSKLDALYKKYQYPLAGIDNDIMAVEGELFSLVKDLTGDEYDTLALRELEKLLGGNK